MSKIRNLLILILVLVAGPAVAANTAWDITPGGLGTGNGACRFVSNNRVCFIDLDTLGTTPILDTRHCENITVKWDSDIATAVFDNDITVRWSNTNSVSANTSEIVVNATLDGNPVNGTDAIYGFDSPFTYLELTADAGGTGRASMQCHPN